MSFLQDSPHLLERAYTASHRLLSGLRRWMKPGGRAERAMIRIETITKGPLFDCKMCGQCVLHSTGMTCPMTCPKHLRNGPCGGVRVDGRCEIDPDMLCVWLLAWERSKRMPVFGSDILHAMRPLDHRLSGTSAWINDLTGTAHRTPAGWGE